MNPIQIMIVGAQKAGTTSLLRYLAQHPSVCVPVQTEMAYFAIDAEYDDGYERAFRKYFGHCRQDTAVLVAKNAALMYLPKAVERLHRHNAGMQVVVLLRNPVARAYSAYWFARRVGREDLRTFEEALAAESARLAGDPLKASFCAYVHNGEYVRHLQTLYRYFDQSQVQVYLTDDLKRDPAEVCRAILGSVGLNGHYALDVGRRHNSAGKARSQLVARSLVAFQDSRHPVRRAVRRLIPDRIAYRLWSTIDRLNSREFMPPTMAPETRAKLVEHFRPFNAELGSLLGRDLNHWNDPGG